MRRSLSIPWVLLFLVLVVVGLVGEASSLAAPLSGVVYEAQTGKPLAGVRVQLFYDANDPLEPELLVPTERLPTSQQSQHTSGDGSYSFELPAGRVYRLAVGSNADHISFPSATVPPIEGFPSFGEISPTEQPRDKGYRPFYMRFDATTASAVFLYNHIAVDQVTDVVALALKVDKAQASLGDVLTYSGTFDNKSQRSFLASERRPVYLEFIAARGLSVAPSSASAEVQIGASPPRLLSVGAQRARAGSDRVMRFGPYDVPAGAQLRIAFKATLGINTRPGRFESRLVSRDAGGVQLSLDAVSTLEIVKDRDLGTSTLLGRVFCDDNQNGAQDPSEAGVFGARIYSDSGSIAQSDRLGRFHFTRVQPGSRLFKVDQGSLAGGKALGSDRRLLRVSEGGAQQLRYPVRCEREWISQEQARVVLPLAPKTKTKIEVLPMKSITLRGRLSPMTLELGGRRLDVPSVELHQEVPKAVLSRAGDAEHGPTLLTVPEGGYLSDMPRWRVAWSERTVGTPVRWRFTIERVETGGLAPVMHKEGKGTPPSFIQWNGLGDSGRAADAGTAHVARLTMISADDTEVASIRHVFGIAEEGGGRRIRTLYGDLFKGQGGDTLVTEQVIEEAQGIITGLGSEGSIEVVVHGDGSGDRLKSLVQTQREAKLIEAIFLEGGIAAARIKVRGRGASALVDSSGSDVAGRRNRRVVFTANGLPGISKFQVPVTVLRKSTLRINGRVTPVQQDGGFETEIPSRPGGSVVVDMMGANGRRAAFRVQLSSEVSPISQAMSEEPVLKTWELEGNVSSRTLAVDFNKAPDALWKSDAHLTAVGALPIPELHTELQGSENRLTSPMDFRLLVHESLSIEQWQLVIAQDDGNVVHRETRSGPVPAVLRWDGLSKGAMVLKSDMRYRYWLELETADSSGFQTAPRWFKVDPSESAVLLEKRGRFFGRSLSPKAALKNALSRFVAKQKSRDNERFSVVLEVVGDAPRVQRAQAALVKYLEVLGVQPALYDLKSTGLVSGRDRISIVSDARPPQSRAAVTMNGRAMPLRDGVFRASIELNAEEPIVVEMTTSDGAKLRLVGADPQPSLRESAAGELIAPTDMDFSIIAGERARDREILASETPAQSLRVSLPKKGVVLGSRELAITGKVALGCQVQVNGVGVDLDSDGSFALVTTLAVGSSLLEIRADDSLGGSSTIVRRVKVAKSHHVALGLVEGIAASAYTTRGWMADSAAIAGMGRDTTFQAGALLLSARAQGYVKARIPGGPLADTVEITAQIDTGREKGTSALFAQVTHPRRTQLAMGDNAPEQQDVNTRGKAYARIQAGRSSAVVGSVHTRLQGGGDLFKYDRSADGALAEVRRKVGGNELALRAFGTTGSMDSSRDVNWFRATGGSLYYLRHGAVLEGSERVRIIVRDRDSGLLLSESDLSEGVDYTVDYEGGRIRLTEALGSSSGSNWILGNLDNSSTPMAGNHVFLNVHYEHEDQDGLSQTAAGAYASTNLEKRLSVGAGIVSEAREGQESYRLVGADASLHLGKRSNLRAEVAATRERDANHSMSQDGGLSFGALQLGQDFERGANDPMQVGWKLSLDLVARDWSTARELSDTSLTAYVQDLQHGFSSGDSALDQGRLKFGGRLEQRLSANDMLLLRHEGQVAQVPRVGPTSAEVMVGESAPQLDERASYLTSVQWARDQGQWHYTLEGMHQRLSSTAALADQSAAIDARRYGLGGMTRFDYSKRLSLRIGQQLIANTRSADPVLMPVSPLDSSIRSSNSLAGVITNIGSDLQLTPDLSIAADVYQRWNGDNAARLGLHSAVSDRGSMYVQEEVGVNQGRVSNTTVLGAQESFGEDNGGRSYGEYQVNRGVLGNRNRAVLGLGRRFQVTKELGVGLGFEHQQAFGGYLPDGSAVGDAQRNVVHASYTLAFPDTFRLAGNLELRFDHGDSGANVDPALFDSDSSMDALGFADHGGSVTGAALVIAPGEQFQVLAGVNAEWKIDTAHTWLARGRTSLSNHTAPGESDSKTLARFTELTTGLAFRPMRDDGLEFLARYSYLSDERPTLASQPRSRSRSHVFALVPYAQLPHRFQLSGKLAIKQTATKTRQASAQDETDLMAILALVRLGYRFYGKWDASAEARYLALIGSSDDEAKFGSLVEIGYAVGRYLRLGAGYNLSHFSDEELGDLTRDSHGFFVRITGQY